MAEACRLLEAGIDDIHALYRRGQLTPARLVEFYLTRIERLDLDVTNGPPFNCVVRICPAVREEAGRIGDEIARQGVTKVLHGIPVWLKDNIDVRGLPTTSGCLALEDHVAARDAALVGRLRSAGAIVMGKVGMTELGKGLSAFSSISVRIGNAVEPRNPPGGSSSGAAVAVALNFGMLAIGVDDCASITSPASLNSCVGLRPTVGLVSRRGLFAHSRSDTSPGPLARTVTDAAKAMDAIAELDGTPGFAAGIADATLGRQRLAVLSTAGSLAFLASVPACMQRAFARQIAALGAAGARVVSDVRLEGFRQQRWSGLEYYNSQAAALRARARPPRTPRQLYSHDKLAPHVRTKRQQLLIRRYGLPIPLPNVWAWTYRRLLRHNQRAFDAALAAAGCDVAIGVTSPAISLLATMAQLPHATVPGGCVEGDAELAADDFVEGSRIPWGISVLGRPGRDVEVMATARACEAFLGARTPPKPGGRVVDGADLRCDIGAFNALKRRISHEGYGTLQIDSTGRYVQPTPAQFRALVRHVTATSTECVCP